MVPKIYDCFRYHLKARTEQQYSKGMKDIIKYYAKAGVLLAIKMNDETVLGTLVKDPDSKSGYAFKSAICPVFIKEENLNY